MRIVGIVFIAAGTLMLIFRGFSFTQEKKVVDIGPLELNKKQEKSIGWPIYAGAIAVAAGVFMVIGDRKKSL